MLSLSQFVSKLRRSLLVFFCSAAQSAPNRSHLCLFSLFFSLVMHFSLLVKDLSFYDVCSQLKNYVQLNNY